MKWYNRFMKYNKLVRDKIPEIIKKNNAVPVTHIDDDKEYWDNMKYNKLVRDKVPEIIKKNNAVPVTHIADDKEYWDKLKEKLGEEVEEFLQESNAKELADILEIIYAIRDFKKISKEELEKIRAGKAEKRGGFKQKIILDETKAKK
jgi:predicted house-cleaning noncanonical NTP pyrophosphatase (MazG superfamily)